MIITKGERQPFPELRGDLKAMRYPAYCEPKLDGEMNWYIRDSSYPTGALLNKSGKVRLGFPIISELQSIGKVRLLGELHWGDGRAGDLYEFLKHQDDDELRFTVFDVDIPSGYKGRHEWLRLHIMPSAHVSIADSYLAHDQTQVNYYYKDCIKRGYEGIVVKSADSRLIMGPCSWVKIKHRETITCIILKIDYNRERIEVMGDPEMKSIGVKVPNKVKTTLKVGDLVEIEHMGVLSQGGLRHPCYIRKVGEWAHPM